MSDNGYISKDILIKDWDKLKPEYQEKLYKYIKKLLQIQRFESRIDGEIHRYEWERKTKTYGEGKCCSFCGKYQDEVSRLIAASEEVFICDDCVEICSEILAEEDKGGIL